MRDNIRGNEGGDVVGPPRDEASREIERSRAEVEQLRASRTRLALDADAERCSIEKALHEGVQQGLVGLAANLELVAASVEGDPVAAKRLLAAMRTDVQQAIEETRTLAHRIYPPLLEAGGLGPALRWIATAASIPIRIDVAAAEGCPRQVAAAIYFCCQAMIALVDEGTPMVVSVRGGEEVLTYEIEVDGDLDLGDLLPDRAAALGGGLTVQPGSARRTRVVGSLPLSGWDHSPSAR